MKPETFGAEWDWQSAIPAEKPETEAERAERIRKIHESLFDEDGNIIGDDE